MLEFIILMVILDILMKWQFSASKEAEQPKKPAPHKDCNKAYVMGNSAEWEFKSLDDAMDFREWRLAGNKGNALDYYRYMEEE